MKTILYLHGAGATPLSFRFIITNLPEHKSLTIQMDPRESVDSIVERVATEIKDQEDLTIIAHSLGGLVGVGLLGLPNVSRLITMSSPFGGHPAALIMSLWSHETMFKDLSPYSSTVRRLQRRWTAANKPHLAITTTSGLPIMGYENDGVVTVASQTALDGPKYEKLDLNHFEVLLSDATVLAIENFVWS